MLGLGDNILPCKKHGIKPQWVEEERNPYESAAAHMGYGLKPKRKLVCFQCESESKAALLQPEINVWNKKQVSS